MCVFVCAQVLPAYVLSRWASLVIYRNENIYLYVRLFVDFAVH